MEGKGIQVNLLFSFIYFLMIILIVVMAVVDFNNPYSCLMVCAIFVALSNLTSFCNNPVSHRAQEVSSNCGVYVCVSVCVKESVEMRKMETSISSTIPVPGLGLENQGRAASMPRLNAEMQVLFHTPNI